MSDLITRETYYGALWDLIQTMAPNPKIATFTRKFRFLEGFADGELPAVVMVAAKQKTKRELRRPPIRWLGADVFLFAASPDPKASADPILNSLIDALEAVMEPAPAFATQTLGETVHSCWIEGETEVFQNHDGTRAQAIVPINMLIP